jgi:hypothetical protein
MARRTGGADMKLSAFDQVAEYVKELRELEAAREAIQYDPLTVVINNRRGMIDIAALTSDEDCRRELGALLKQRISGVRAALITYNVEVDQ